VYEVTDLTLRFSITAPRWNNKIALNFHRLPGYWMDSIHAKPLEQRI
jgi:hypothetical protein